MISYCIHYIFVLNVVTSWHADAVAQPMAHLRPARSFVNANKIQIPNITNYFRIPLNSELNLQRFAVRRTKGILYLAGLNRLYKLSSTLTKEQEFDTLSCSDDNDECKKDRPDKNYNSILLINEDTRELVVCGAADWGNCAVHNMRDIGKLRRVESPFDSFVALENTYESSVTAMLMKRNASAKEAYRGQKKLGTALFVASDPRQSFKSNTKLSHWISPFMNMYWLQETGRPMEEVKIGNGLQFFGARVAGTNNLKNFPMLHRAIEFVASFTHESAFYVFANQYVGRRIPNKYFKSVVYRVCNNTQSMLKLAVLIELKCETASGRFYNLLQDVKLFKPGKDLRDKKGYGPEEMVFAGAFNYGADESTPGLNPSDFYRNKTTTNSAICLFSIGDIVHHLEKCVQDCLACGRVENNRCPHRFKPLSLLKDAPYGVTCTTDIQCTSRTSDTDDGYSKPKRCVTPLSIPSVHVTDKFRYTSIEATVTPNGGQFSTIFVGTDNGVLLGLSDLGGDSPHQYYESIIDDDTLVQLSMDTSDENVYSLSRTQLSKVAIPNCEQHTYCDHCLNAKNPYCGWCEKTHTCTKQATCASRDGWKNYKEGKCPKIMDVKPDDMYLRKPKQFELIVENIPDGTINFTCVFVNIDEALLSAVDSYTVVAKYEPSSKISCASPSEYDLTMWQKAQLNKDIINAKISLRDQVGVLEIARQNVRFYDCDAYKTCGDCVVSKFTCNWCSGLEKCLDSKEIETKCVGYGKIINGEQATGTSSSQGKKYCPQFVDVDSDRTTKLYVPVDQTKGFKFQLSNIETLMTDYVCVFDLATGTKRLGATVDSDDVIHCDALTFAPNMVGLGDGGAEKAVEIKIVYTTTRGIPGSLENLNGLEVNFYHCKQLATSCGECIMLNRVNYKCGWCSAMKACTIRVECGHATAWLNGDQNCPNPAILSFTPTSGPLNGGTLLTINGVDFPRQSSEISLIQVHNSLCRIKSTLYDPPKQLKCTINDNAVTQNDSGVVMIKTKFTEDHPARSVDKYSFVQPQVTHLTPNDGIQAGSTRLTIHGTNLNCGSESSVKIGDYPGCRIDGEHSNSTAIVCESGHQSSVGPKSISVSIDNWSQVLGQTFTVYADPTIDFMASGPFRSIQSGGIRHSFKVDGAIRAVQRAKMYIEAVDHVMDGLRQAGSRARHSRDTQRESSHMQEAMCAIDVDMQQINCSTPEYGRNMTGAKKASFGILLDGAKLSSSEKISYYVDPSFKVPDGETTGDAEQSMYLSKRIYERSDVLVLKGQHLDVASEKRDVAVNIGTAKCPVLSLTMDTLTCDPPAKQPAKRDTGLEYPEIEVRIGNFRQTVGYLSYGRKSSGITSGFGTVLAIGVAVAVVIVVAVVVIIVYKRKSTRHHRDMKNMQEQITQIEMKVAMECKDAFTELQTGMNAIGLSSDEYAPHMSTAIPFLSYRDYVLQVLFPQTPNHIVSRDLEVEEHRREQVEAGLHSFNALLMNKTFLLLLVRTLESNKSFLSKDRVYVGSLLMIILQEKLEYCTDILKTLLSDLIERTIDKHHAPKILFRRSESVAERMLGAWFTFLMHRYLTECAGQPLYWLFSAIKFQTEKGPQDVVSCDARYSLSEQKLIRESITYQELTIFVSGLETSDQLPIRVLDCDTITQVKEKCLDIIYRLLPYSHRPSATDLDLEWHTGKTGRIVLQDLDSMTKTEQGYRQLNNLAHYKVPSGASFSIIPRQHASLFNMSLGSTGDRSLRSTSTFSLKNSPSLPRAFSPNKEHQSKDHEGVKVYHLVKPDAEQHSDKGKKLVTEVYLTRLLTTKGTLQKFIDDLFETIFSTAHRGSALPVCVKYMFDFLDDQAIQFGIQDAAETVHAWKSNSLPLRFWVNLIKNPHFVFDIAPPIKIESCLSVVAQTLMDACSTQDPQLTKDSPSSKLLFAKDIVNYREWVDRYYTDISDLPAFSDQDMNAFLAEEGRLHQQEFNIAAALLELYGFLKAYREQFVASLEEDEFSRRHRLAEKLFQVQRLLDYNDTPTPIITAVGRGGVNV